MVSPERQIKESLEVSPNKTIKCCFVIVTCCIIWLTILASIILIMNHCSQNTATHSINNSSAGCIIDTITTPNHDININMDSAGIVFNNKDEHKLSSIEINTPEQSGFLDSIIYNLTLAVNSINNVLTSGSILIAILTLFIGLVGFFAYHSLKEEVRNDLAKSDKIINQKVSEITQLENNIVTFKNDINERIKQIEHFKTLMINLARYSNKSFDYLLLTTLYNVADRINDEDLRDKVFHDFSIISLYRKDLYFDDKESAELLQRKKEAIEYLIQTASEDDIKEFESILQDETDNEIRRKIIELITSVKKLKNKS